MLSCNFILNFFNHAAVNNSKDEKLDEKLDNSRQSKALEEYSEPQKTSTSTGHAEQSLTNKAMGWVSSKVKGFKQGFKKLAGSKPVHNRNTSKVLFEHSKLHSDIHSFTVSDEGFNEQDNLIEHFDAVYLIRDIQTKDCHSISLAVISPEDCSIETHLFVTYF